MNKELENKILKLYSLEKEISNLRIEITCEIESQYSKFINKRVKITGQKGWSTGILKSVKANISYNGKPDITCFIKAESGRASKNYVPFKNIEFLSEQETKEFNLHNSITEKI